MAGGKSGDRASGSAGAGENCEKEVWFPERSLGTGLVEAEKARKNANAGWNLTYVADAGNLIRAKRNCICGASPAT